MEDEVSRDFQAEVVTQIDGIRKNAPCGAAAIDAQTKEIAQNLVRETQRACRAWFEEFRSTGVEPEIDPTVMFTADAGPLSLLTKYALLGMLRYFECATEDEWENFVQKWDAFFNLGTDG